MRKDVLRWLTWEDLAEIVVESKSVFNDEEEQQNEIFDTTESHYREVLRRLRVKYNCRPPIIEVYPPILSAAELATGWKLTTDRCMQNTIIRCFVTYKLHNDGYSYGEISKMMRRDHSTITHYYIKMRDMLSVPFAYKPEMAAYKRFQELC